MDWEFLNGEYSAGLSSHGFINLIGARHFQFSHILFKCDAVLEMRLQVSLIGHLQAGRILVQVISGYYTQFPESSKKLLKTEVAKGDYH